jgi:uncharacterized protein YigE (DUF2233 family)
MGQALQTVSVSTLLLALIEAGGDPAVFCYRMGVGILSAGQARFLEPAVESANFQTPASPKRNQLACSNLFSTLSARFSTLKD